MVRLRFGLARGLPGPLPKACRLPKHYPLELASDRQVCPHCRNKLRRIRTSRHYPVGLMLGQPCVRLVQKKCVACGRLEISEALRGLVPAGGNYAFDLIVEIGLARFRDHRQDGEIQRDLRQRWGLSLPVSSIGSQAHAFLDGLAATHRAHTVQLRQAMTRDDGYALHLDGTCEAGTDILFACFASPRGWTLEIGKISSENVPEISQILQRCVTQFGEPLATMRDLSPNIAQATQKVLPKTHDLICHYHFLENVGTRLCEKPHAKLTGALRRLKIRAILTSLRKDLVRHSRRAEKLSSKQIDDLLAGRESMTDLEPATGRRFVAFAMLRWLEDFTADLRGEYFPFDLPSLSFYRRGIQLEQLLRPCVEAADFSRQRFSTLHTIARHLATLREDAEVVQAAERLDKAAKLFQQLRDMLRLDSHPRQRLFRSRGPREDRQVAATMKQRLDDWREALRRRIDQERDPDQRADQQVVLDYLRKYEQQLVGHVIPVKEKREPFVVPRTNNLAEHRFGSTKRGVRRKVGTKKLTRHVQAMRAEELLVANLADPEYVKIVCGGGLIHLPATIATNWPKAQSIRASRHTSRNAHPIPITKKQIRQPNLLDKVRTLIKKAAGPTSAKGCAA